MYAVHMMNIANEVNIVCTIIRIDLFHTGSFVTRPSIQPRNVTSWFDQWYIYIYADMQIKMESSMESLMG